MGKILEEAWEVFTEIIPALVIIFILLCLVGVPLFLFTSTEKSGKCTVYSEPKIRHGFHYVGKVYVPTTYTSRDCLVYEDEK